MCTYVYVYKCICTYTYICISVYSALTIVLHHYLLIYDDHLIRNYFGNQIHTMMSHLLNIDIDLYNQELLSSSVMVETER